MYSGNHVSIKQHTNGYLLVLVLVFGAIFFTIFSSFIGFLVTESKIVNQRVEILRARDIAEAGLNYYKWFLAHNPGDTTNGTGLPGPYIHFYEDNEEGLIGQFELTVASTTYCGEVAGIEVSSTGFTFVDPSVRRTVSARYSRPSLANYSLVTNAGVWYGAGGNVVGPIHSNQGIRMDSAHNATVSSGFAEWNCDRSFGCDPAVADVPGVYTTSGDATPGLFEYPVAPIDFEGRIAVSLANLKDRAENHGGIYLPKTPPGQFGYRLRFNSNDTVSVQRVTNTRSYWAFSPTEGWHTSERNDFTGLSTTTIYPIDSECPVIYVEDKTWIEGVINQKITLAAADLTTSTEYTPIVIQGSITYTGTSSGLLAIAEGDVDLGIDIDNNIEINGIFIAQNGRFGRNFYCTSSCNYMVGASVVNTQLPLALRSPINYNLRNSLTMLGTIASKVRAAVRWTNSGVVTSGMVGTISTYDRNQVDNPPPYVPSVTDVYTFTDWREEGN